MSRSIRLSFLAVLSVAALAAGGCGEGSTSIKTTAETEGIYLDVGGMKYQIQMSRYLNPNDIEDRGYLVGLPSGAEPTGEETYFGVWMRVQNLTDEPKPAATEYEIHDTQDAVYRPIELDTNNNVFAYRGRDVAPQGLLPDPDSAAGEGPIQGALLLFKVTNASLQNRPLEFKIMQGGKEATADLDV